MLDALKFVKGAVAKKDFVPALTHFRIENGLIKGYNGKIGLCSPIDLDLNVSPRAVPFAKAIQTCKTTVSMHMTNSGRLAIKSGKFKAFVECTEEIYPDVKPEGDIIELAGDFLPAIKKIAPFIAEDASRPWAKGVLFCNESAFATNNLIVIEYWLGYSFPTPVNVPQVAINELIRINQEPVSIQLTENSITFHFEDGRWLRSALLDLGWPNVYKVLDGDSHQTPPPSTLFDAVEDLSPFVDELGRMWFTNEKITTCLDDDIGASINMEGLPEAGCFNNKQLLLLNKVVEKIDFTLYPRPCLFTGGPMRGALIGFRE